MYKSRLSVIVLLFLLVVSTTCFAAPTRVIILNGNESVAGDGSNPLVISNGVQLGTRFIHRNATNDTDTFTYGSGDTDKVNLSGYKYVIVETYMPTGSTTWDLTPQFGDASSSSYINGQKRTITQNERFILEVDGETQFITKLDGKTGSGNISVYLTPMN